MTPEERKARERARYLADQEKFKARAKANYQKNREKVIARVAAWKRKNRERYNLMSTVSNKRWRSANPEKVRAAKDRHKRLPHEVVKSKLRKRVSRLIKANGHPLSRSLVIGCTSDQLRSHLESKFKPGMTWGNYGTVWNVDHITPLAACDDINRLPSLNHFTNLQPLFAHENTAKGASMPPGMQVLPAWGLAE